MAVQARDAATPFRRSLAADAGRSLDGAVFDAAGQLERTHRWRLLPAAAVVELDAGNERRLRVLVSLALARDNQQSIFFQAVGSVALALALVLAVVLLILRQPRRSLAEANRYAAQLPFQPLQALPHEDAGLGAINTLRDSLNTVARCSSSSGCSTASTNTGSSRRPTRRGRHRGQEHLPGPHEPRDPHAAQWRAGADATGAQHAAVRAPAPPPADGAPVGHQPA